MLVISNIFWIYTTIENAVGQNDYKISCDEYYNDMIEFKKIIEAHKTKKDLQGFLKSNDVEFDSIQKGTDFIISLNSFSILFDQRGNQKSVQQN